MESACFQPTLPRPGLSVLSEFRRAGGFTIAWGGKGDRGAVFCAQILYTNPVHKSFWANPIPGPLNLAVYRNGATFARTNPFGNIPSPNP